MNDERVFTTEIAHKANIDSIEGESFTAIFEKKLYGDGELIAVEEEIRVQFKGAKVISQASKPRTQGARPDRSAARSQEFELADAYANAPRAELGTTIEDYVLPLYAEQ